MTVLRLGSYPTYPVRNQRLSLDQSTLNLTVLDSIAISTRRHRLKSSVVITGIYAGEGVKLEISLYTESTNIYLHKTTRGSPREGNMPLSQSKCRQRRRQFERSSAQ